MLFKEKLKNLWIFCLQSRNLRGDMTKMYGSRRKGEVECRRVVVVIVCLNEVLELDVFNEIRVIKERKKKRKGKF